MKLKIHFLLASLFLGAHVYAGNLFEEMAEVNSRWLCEKDIPDFVHQSTLTFSSDEEKIRMHLKLVHQILSTRETDHLSAEEKKNRLRNLDNLLHYYTQESLPKNTVAFGRIPVFIDPFDNFCAVGYLIKASGHEALSRSISQKMNYAYLLNMKDDALHKWVSKCGLTAKELAWIQPGYYNPVSWDEMKSGTSGEVTAVADLGPMGMLFGGQFDSAGAARVDNLALWQNGLSGLAWLPFSNNGVNGKVTDIEYHNGEIYVSGYFNFADTTYAGSGVVRWDGAQWVPLGEFYTGALANVVHDLEFHRDTLYAGGYIRSKINAPSLFTNLAKWDGAEWVSAGGSPQGVVYALKSAGDSLLLGGTFDHVDGKPMARIASLKKGLFSPVGQGLGVAVHAIELHENSIYAGGGFQSTANDTFGLAVFKNGDWQNLLPPHLFQAYNAHSVVQVLESTPYGLFVGGDFSYSAMFDIGINLIRYDQNKGFYPMGALDGPVSALCYSNTKLFVGGRFARDYSIPGQPADLGNTVSVDIATMFSVGEKPLRIQAQVYPNPSSGAFTLEIPENARVKNLRFIGISGKSFPVQYQTAAHTLELDVSGLANGEYVLYVETSKGVVHEKVLLQKP